MWKPLAIVLAWTLAIIRLCSASYDGQVHRFSLLPHPLEDNFLICVMVDDGGESGRHTPNMNIYLLKTLHVAGVFALFTSLGSILLAGSGKKGASILHGISLVLVLLLGFAMLGKPPMHQTWWMIKIGLWLFIGLAPTLAKRKVLPASIVLQLCLLAAACAAYLGMAKPF